MNGVRLGVFLPRERMETREDVRAALRRIEDAGLDHVGIADHVSFHTGWGQDGIVEASMLAMLCDLPIYVAEGSADVAAHPEIFKRGLVAGVPPDAFTDKGQLWGNPVYDWPALRRTGYAWWIARFRRIFELFDVARIDHFRGFTAYWAVPADAEFADGLENCRQCAAKAECGSWLASGQREGYQRFCPNARFVERVAERAAR